MKKNLSQNKLLLFLLCNSISNQCIGMERQDTTINQPAVYKKDSDDIITYIYIRNNGHDEKRRRLNPIHEEALIVSETKELTSTKKNSDDLLDNMDVEN